MEFGGAQPLTMNKNKMIGFLQSVVMIPVVMTSLPYQIINSSGAPIIETTVGQLNSQPDEDPQAMQMKREAAQIDAYFASNGMPLAGYGMKMVEESYKNDIDPFLLPAIATRESTGGKHACKSVKNSPFGYGSCKISYSTMDKSIETVAASIGGNNPRTAKYYANKSTEGILKTYNPDYIVPGYSRQVITIMGTISDFPIAENGPILAER